MSIICIRSINCATCIELQIRAFNTHLLFHSHPLYWRFVTFTSLLLQIDVVVSLKLGGFWLNSSPSLLTKGASFYLG